MIRKLTALAVATTASLTTVALVPGLADAHPGPRVVGTRVPGQ